MADHQAQKLEDQLKKIGCNFRFWGRAELKELENVLFPNENVEMCVNGQYEGGFAMLVATDQRVLLIDKKPMYLTLEDIRFDMIAEVDYNHRMLNANIFICTPTKSLRFLSYNHARLRKLFHFVQTRVMEIRQHYQQGNIEQQSQQYVGFARQLAEPESAEAALPVETTMPDAAPEVPQEEITTKEPNQLALEVEAKLPESKTLRYLRKPRMAPLVTAYTRMPLMSRQKRFLGSRAMNTPFPSSYSRQQ